LKSTVYFHQSMDQVLKPAVFALLLPLRATKPASHVTLSGIPSSYE
jgi:hypothetical protein